MRDLAILFLHLIVALARLAGPGGLRSVVAESVLLKTLFANHGSRQVHHDQTVAIGMEIPPRTSGDVP